MSPELLEDLARLFGVLSEASRLRLLQELMAGGQTVSELVESTGMKQGNVSKHLGVLHRAGFLQRVKLGNFVRYEICDQRVFDLCEIMCERERERALTRASRL